MNQEDIRHKIVKVILTELFYWARPDINEELLNGQVDLVNDLGFDSLGLIEFGFALEDEFKLIIPDEDVQAFATIQDWVDYINKKLIAPDNSFSSISCTILDKHEAM